MLHSVSDDEFARHLKTSGMATPEQIEEALKLAPLPLADALVQRGVITPLQRETVEKKLEAKPGGVSELGGNKLLKKIGEGGMGAVYLAEDTLRKRKVALKILPKKHASNADFLKRFRREAEAATTLDHPNIVQAYSAGEDRGYHFYVMEYCEGESLRKRIERLKHLPAADACGIVLQVARGLQHAHERGFIHRDVKPENLIVTPAGTVKILDLGLAKNLSDTDATFRTVTGAALGTPHYISPEQARGEKSVDGRTDIYSLGATLYHLITGQVPFQGSSIFEIIQKHLMEQLADPRDIRPEIPEGVVQVVRKMLAKSPDDRHRDCLQLIGDLERLAAKQAPLTTPLDAARSSVAMPRAAAAPPPSRKHGLVVGGAAAALLLVGIVTYAVWPSAPVPTPEPPKKITPPPVAKADPPKVEPKIEDPRPEPPKPPPPPPEPAKVEPEPVKPEPPKPEPPKPEPPKAEPLPVPDPPKPEPEPAKPVKVAVPANRAKAEADFKTQFKDDLAKTAPSDKAAFARKLLTLPPAAEPADQYHRLITARDVAAVGGDPATVLAAAERLAEGFLVDLLTLKADGIIACSTKVTESATAAAGAALQLIDDAVAADRYDLASKLAAKAKSASDPLKNDELKSAAAAALTATDRLQKEWQSVAAYARTLAEKPQDATAGFHVGRFLCLVKEDWERGLPLLAKGAHKDYRTAAEKELAKDKDGQVQKEICEAWLALAKSEPKGIRKDNLTERARMWFTQAESSFLPADAAKVAKELETLEKGAAPKPSLPRSGVAKTALPKNGLDILPRVNRDSLGRGRNLWTQTKDGGLVSPALGDSQNPSLIHIPFSPGEEYDLYVEAQRTAGNADIVFGLSSGANEFAMGIDGWGGRGSGFNGMGGQFRWQQSGPGLQFADGKVHMIRFEVRSGGAKLFVDDTPIVTLDSYSRSSIPAPSLTQGKPPGQRCLSIATVASTYQITRVYLVPRRT